MKFKLNDEIIGRADKCRENLSCLNGDKSCLCEVEHMIDETLLSIKPPTNKPCAYRILYGYSSHYCFCPIRKEIYKHYNC